MPNDKEFFPEPSNDQIAQLRNGLLNAKEEYIRNLAGEHADKLMASREAAEAYLESSDFNLRRAAIEQIVFRWETNEAFVDFCTNQLLHETDIDLRQTALAALVKIFSGMNSSKTIQLVYSLATDKDQPDAIRLMAYHSLFRLDGSQLGKEERNRMSEGAFEIPKDFDEEAMRRFSAY